MEKRSDILFLIGMPGSGKTFWSHKVSDQYGFELFDTDQLIETKEHALIPEIFDNKGEAYFRLQEHELLKELIQENAGFYVVSTGGGMPCFHDNLQQMKTAGTVIYLQASVDTLYENLKKELSGRPLLQEYEDDLKQRLATLLNARASCYEKADYIFNVEELTLSKFAAIFAS